MLTVGAILVWEIYLASVDRLILPGVALAGLAFVLLVAVGWAAHADARGRFVGRLGLTLGIIWYLGSVGRWMPPVDAMVTAAPGPSGEFLALAFLLMAPVSLALAPTIRYIPRKRVSVTDWL